ncbi:MAG: hypothetical protein WAM14_04710 [Candidatus Nitrosopolaris sp.]
MISANAELSSECRGALQNYPINSGANLSAKEEEGETKAIRLYLVKG